MKKPFNSSLTPRLRSEPKALPKTKVKKQRELQIKNMLAWFLGMTAMAGLSGYYEVPKVSIESLTVFMVFFGISWWQLYVKGGLS